MPILNYTTKVPAAKTIQEISDKLVRHGAKAIMIEYDLMQPSGLSFIVTTKYGDVPFRLPANIKAVRTVLEQQGVRRFVDLEMAANIAWRILKDWTEAQMAIIEADLATLEQVFLPYMQLSDSKDTLYDAMVAKGFYLTEGGGKNEG